MDEYDQLAAWVFYKRLGQRLRTLRVYNKVRLKELSALLGVTYQQYQKYERGVTRLHADRLVKLKRFYDVSYASLLD